MGIKTTAGVAVGLSLACLAAAAIAGEARSTLMVHLVVRPTCQIDQLTTTSPPVVNCSQAPYRVQPRNVADIPRDEREGWAKLAPSSSVAGVWEVTF